MANSVCIHEEGNILFGATFEHRDLVGNKFPSNICIANKYRDFIMLI